MEKAKGLFITSTMVVGHRSCDWDDIGCRCTAVHHCSSFQAELQICCHVPSPQTPELPFPKRPPSRFEVSAFGTPRRSPALTSPPLPPSPHNYHQQRTQATSSHPFSYPNTLRHASPRIRRYPDRVRLSSRPRPSNPHF